MRECLLDVSTALVSVLREQSWFLQQTLQARRKLAHLSFAEDQPSPGTPNQVWDLAGVRADDRSTACHRFNQDASELLFPTTGRSRREHEHVDRREQTANAIVRDRPEHRVARLGQRRKRPLDVFLGASIADATKKPRRKPYFAEQHLQRASQIEQTFLDR